jgi:hypothetical protein
MNAISEGHRNAMTSLIRILPVVTLIALSGCATSNTTYQPVNNPMQPVTPTSPGTVAPRVATIHA